MAFMSSVHGSLMLVVLILVSLVATCSGCSPIDGSSEVDIPEKFKNSDIVALGKVLKSVYDENKAQQGWNISKVEFLINCVYKGAPVNQNVTIEEVGHVPGLCISINLQVDHDYIVYLRKSADGKLTHDQVVPDEGVDSYIDEVLSSDCASVSFPTDVLEGQRFRGCGGTNYNSLPECSATEAAAPTQESTTEPSKKEPQSEDQGDKIDVPGDKSDVPENKNSDTPTEVGESKGENSAESKISNIFLILSLLFACFFYA